MCSGSCRQLTCAGLCRPHARAQSLFLSLFACLSACLPLSLSLCLPACLPACLPPPLSPSLSLSLSPEPFCDRLFPVSHQGDKYTQSDTQHKKSICQNQLPIKTIPHIPPHTPLSTNSPHAHVRVSPKSIRPGENLRASRDKL